MHLALFDLDHTLIPFDSGNAFARFLIERGILGADFEPQYIAYCHAYAAGTLDMHVMHRYTVGALRAHPPPVLQGWLAAFEQAITPRIPAAAIARVRAHREAGHRCVLVTATTRLIAECFARPLGLDAVLATEPAYDANGHVTGEIVGVPCFRDDKVRHVERWLAQQRLGWADLRRSWFYSDSINDLALLAAVSDPVAVSPDPRLADEARRRGWQVLPREALAPTEAIR